MLTWTTLGTTTGVAVLVHGVPFLMKRIWPHLSTTITAWVTAEVLLWAYGASTTPWSWVAAVLWTANGLIVAAIALGGVQVVTSLSSSSPP